ncbi:MAG: hypothetical protein CMO47_00465 [Verrucomicrobiales bacterium]|nr:hypothetical protein [Verrucomicrobiales bacterium]
MPSPSDFSTNFRNDAQSRNDGALINVLTGLGTNKSKIEATRVGHAQLASQTELESLYTYGLVRRIVDSVANECTKKRTTLELGDETVRQENDILPRFDEFLKQNEFHQKLSEVIKLQRLYGGAGLVLLIDDGLQPEEPVDETRIRGVNDFIPLSRHELTPQDFTITDYSRPSHYLINTSQKLTDIQEETYTNLRIHSSRVARFDGLYLPWNLRNRNSGWGQSVVGSIWYALKKYWTAQDGLVEIAQDADVFVHKIPGLFQRIAAGNESDLKKRLEANSLSRSVYGGLAVDTEEELEFLNRNLSGLQTALDPFLTELCAAIGWPKSLLTGESPGGLGKEGRFEERMWAAIVEDWQENYMRTAITQVFRYILLSKEGPTRGIQPPSWAVHFPSTFVETDKEKAELRLQMAQVDAQYIQLGVVNPIEVRQSRWGETEYSIETTLNEAVSRQLEVSADAQFQSQMAGYDAQMQAMNNPEEAAAPEQEDQAATTAGGNAATQTKQPDNSRKTDSFEVYDAQNLRIQVTHKLDSIRAGHVVGADGQRLDGAQNAAVMVFGPHRSKAYRVYRARFDVDGESVDGPYATAFASLKAARDGVRALYPRQDKVSLSPIPAGELESLQIGWGTY